METQINNTINNKKKSEDHQNIQLKKKERKPYKKAKINISQIRNGFVIVVVDIITQWLVSGGISRQKNI